MVQLDGDDRRLAWPTTSLIGRERELDEVSRLIDDPSTRIVTITGPGGSGKTRLSLEAAWRASPGFADGAVFIPLADVGDSNHVVSEVSRALGFVDSPGQHPADQLVSGLRTRHHLLVLDNFEHLTAAASLVAEIVVRCPQVVVLVTSRRRLGVSGERVVAISGLPLPGPTAIDSAEIGTAAAVKLFVERAASVNSAFDPTPETLASVAELCALVDGLPLAIELLASYVRLLPVDALVERLVDGNTTLGLEQTIAWSYGLLSPAAARLLPRLSVFNDGCSLDGIEAVCLVGDDAATMLDALLELVDLHLVEPTSLRDGSVRFGLLETVHRFAHDHLASDPDRNDLVDRHASYYQRLAVGCGDAYNSPAVVAATAEIHRELANVRAALQRLEQTQRWSDAADAVVALCDYWNNHGPFEEADRWLARFDDGVSLDRQRRARIESWRIMFEFWRTFDEPATPELDITRLGYIDRLNAVRTELAEFEDWSAWAQAATHQLITMLHARRFDESDTLVTDTLAGLSDTAWRRPDLLHFWAQGFIVRDRIDRARATLEEAIESARELNNAQALCRATTVYAMLADDPAQAFPELERVLEISTDIGDRRGSTIAAGVLGVLAQRAGDLPRAAMYFRRELELGLDINFSVAVMRGISGVVGVASGSHRWADAAFLHGALLNHFEPLRKSLIETTMTLYLKVVDDVRAALGQDFDAEVERGRQATWEGAIDVARAVAGEIADRVEAPSRPRRRGPRANRDLTDRELDVLAELVAGRTNSQIGSSLGISAKTVMHHTMAVYRKLGVRGRAEAVAYAIRTGLVNA